MRPDPAASPAPSYPALAVTVVTLALAYGISEFLSRELVYALGMIGMIIGVGGLWLVALAPSAWLATGYAVRFGVGYSAGAHVLRRGCRQRGVRS